MFISRGNNGVFNVFCHFVYFLFWYIWWEVLTFSYFVCDRVVTPRSFILFFYSLTITLQVLVHGWD